MPLFEDKPVTVNHKTFEEMLEEKIRESIGVENIDSYEIFKTAENSST